MGRIIQPGFFTKPPNILIQNAALERLLSRYEEMLTSWSRVLASMAKHGPDLAKGRGVRPVQGGFSVPFDWQADLPRECDLNIVEDQDARVLIVRMLNPTQRVQAATSETYEKEGYHVPEEEKELERKLT